MNNLNMDELFDKTVQNSNAIHDDTKCCCFYCGKTFLGKEIKDNIMEHPFLKTRTTLCPFCGMDAVLSEESLPEGYILDDEMVAKIQSYLNK